MKVSVVEAMRIQKEIAGIIQKMMCQDRYICHGTYKEDGVTVNVELPNTIPVNEYLEGLGKLFIISEAVNSFLASFAVTNGVADKVRHRENLKSLLRFYEDAIAKQPPAETVKIEIVGNTRNKVVKTFEPFVSKKELKEEVKSLKAAIRMVQSEIDVIDAQIVNLPFEYEQIDFLTKE